MNILLLGPASDDPSTIDQALGARLLGQTLARNQDIVVTEEVFRRDHGDLERKLARWRDKIYACGFPGSDHGNPLIQQIGIRREARGNSRRRVQCEKTG